MGSVAGSRDSALHLLLWFRSEVSSPLGHDITTISNWEDASPCPGPLALREKPLLLVWGVHSSLRYSWTSQAMYPPWTTNHL